MLIAQRSGCVAAIKYFGKLTVAVFKLQLFKFFMLPLRMGANFLQPDIYVGLLII